MNQITVSVKEYERRPVALASRLTYKTIYAFWVEFPDGTRSWSHNRANVRALAREYYRAHEQTPVAIDWTDCGTYDP